MAEQRRLFFELINQGIKNPVIIKRDYQKLSLDEVRLYSSTDLGALFIDGFGDGVWLTAVNEKQESEKTSKLTFVKETKEKLITGHSLEFYRQRDQEYRKQNTLPALLAEEHSLIFKKLRR